MLRWDGSAPGRDAILPVMSEPPYRLTDLGDRRVLTVDGREYATAYSARVIRMLIERKGLARTAPYLSYKETRGRQRRDRKSTRLNSSHSHISYAVLRLNTTHIDSPLP